MWPEYGRSLREKYDLDGGMQWKSPKGIEYLTRYRQDPETGKKKWSSLGRRSPETEAIYAEFMGRRANARQTIQAHKDDKGSDPFEPCRRALACFDVCGPSQ